jgi:hypothetical protein
MTGRTPFAVLGVAEDASYQEVQRAFRRRVKRTHPDGGGDAGEFDTVVRAFDVVREALPPQRRPGPARPTPYDSWLRPVDPVGEWTDDGGPSFVTPAASEDGWATPRRRSAESDFSTVLLSEMTKAQVPAVFP